MLRVSAFDVFSIPNDDVYVRREHEYRWHSYSSVLLNVIYVGCGTVASTRIGVTILLLLRSLAGLKCIRWRRWELAILFVKASEDDLFDFFALTNPTNRYIFKVQTDIRLHFFYNLCTSYLNKKRQSRQTSPNCFGRFVVDNNRGDERTILGSANLAIVLI